MLFEWGGNRSEFSLIKAASLAQDHSYWLAFAIYVPDSFTASGIGSDVQSFWQVHSQNDDSPPLSLVYYGGARADHPGEGDKLHWKHTMGDAVMQEEDIFPEPDTMPRNKWIKYIVHYKKTFTGSPSLQIWRAFGSGAVDYQKNNPVVNRTKPFGYDLPGLPDWSKQGIYKWTMDYYGSATDRTIYTYGEFLQEGDDLYQQAVNSLSDL